MEGKKALDLSELDTVRACEAGAEFEVEHPKTGEGTGAFIEMYGPDSSTVQRLRKQQSNRAFRRLRTSGTKKGVTAEEFDEESIAFLAAATKGWREFVENGKVLEFNIENAADVYRRFPAIREQADRFINVRANFMKG